MPLETAGCPGPCCALAPSFTKDCVRITFQTHSPNNHFTRTNAPRSETGRATATLRLSPPGDRAAVAHAPAGGKSRISRMCGCPLILTDHCAFSTIAGCGPPVPRPHGSFWTYDPFPVNHCPCWRTPAARPLWRVTPCTARLAPSRRWQRCAHMTRASITAPQSKANQPDVPSATTSNATVVCLRLGAVQGSQPPLHITQPAEIAFRLVFGEGAFGCRQFVM